MKSRRLALVLSFLEFCASCGSTRTPIPEASPTLSNAGGVQPTDRTPEPTSSPRDTPQPQQSLDPRLEALFSYAASTYPTWDLVDDEVRWAPGLCRMQQPGWARISEAPAGAHRRKLYFLYALDPQAYGFPPNPGG